jgi:cellulose synthase (UDP-forming)
MRRPSSIEIWITRLSIGLTAIFWVVSASAILDVRFSPLRIAPLLQEFERYAFLAIASFAVYGSLMYQVARLGFLARRRASQVAPHNGAFRCQEAMPRLTILVPSYDEEEHVIRKTLLAAALQQYPNRRVVLLIDDHPQANDARAMQRLAAARAIPSEIEALLQAPACRLERALAGFQERQAKGGFGAPAELRRLSCLYRDVAAWCERQARTEPLVDHSDDLFIRAVFLDPGRQYRESAAALEKEADGIARGESETDPVMSSAELLEHYRFLAGLFRVGLASFERKRYVNLSHEPNKAMNLNSYIGLLGGKFREVRRDSGFHLDRTDCEDGALDIPDADYVLTLDADTILVPDYATRLMDVMERRGNERLALAQSPYCAFPAAGRLIERIAGATTDVQFMLHQGLTHWRATFWVGANALLRKSALQDICQIAEERGFQIPKFIHNKTVVEDTESTIHLLRRGWQLYNYPGRLAYSATPGDFGALIIQRRRWGGGGVLLVPDVLRYVFENDRGVVATSEALLRFNYLFSSSVVNVGAVLTVLLPFDDAIRALWIPLMVLPYYALYSRDLVLAGYRAGDVVRVYALNLLLIPVSLSGTLDSIKQALTGRKVPFVRTPKTEHGTRTPLPYFVAIYAMLGICILGFIAGIAWERPLQAAFALLHAMLFCYGITRYVGLSARVRWFSPPLYRTAAQSPSCPVGD